MNILNFDTSKKRDVVAMGRIGVDLYPNEFGPMEEVLTFSKYVGGSPANTAVAMAQMGIDTGFIGKVSQDHFGSYVKHYLKSKGVDVSHIKADADPNVRNSLAVAQMPEMGSINYFFYRHDVADLHISTDEIDEEYISQFKAILISGTSLCTSPAREAVLLAMEYAKRNNVRIIFDPDYREMAWKNRSDTAVYYWLACQKADAIFATREEFDAVEYLLMNGNTDDKKTAETFLSYGVKMICIKHGREGSYVYTNDGKSYKGNIFPSKVYKALGAGDSFAGAFMAQLVRGAEIEKALKYAAASASLTISGKSCSDSMPTLEQTEEFIRVCESGEIKNWEGWV